MKEVVFVYKTGEDIKVSDLIQVDGSDEAFSDERAWIGRIGIVLGTALEEYDERKGCHCLRLYMFNPPQQVYCFNTFRLKKISL